MTDSTLRDQVITALRSLLEEPGDQVPRYKIYQKLAPILAPKTALSDEPAINALDDMLQRLRHREHS